MKLPYRARDSFALPVGDGTHVPARILACEHRVLTIEAAGVTLRAYDSALVLKRWRAGDEAPVREASTPALGVHARDDTVVGPARAERIVATQLGVANLELTPLIVRAGTYVPQWPTIRTAAQLAAVPSGTRILHCSGRDALPDSGALARFTKLEALRLVRIDAPVDLRVLRALPVRWLALEAPRDVRNVAALHDFESLEQLELLHFWQSELDEVMPLVRLPKLVRVEIDAGGRRKNAELYRRARWAYPWPFEFWERTTRSMSRVAAGSGSTQITL